MNSMTFLNSTRASVGSALVLLVCFVVITRMYPLAETYLGYNIFHPDSDPESISLCVISKDELDVKEFVEYHSNIGIDKIFFLDNNSSSSSQFNDVLEYIKSGVVEYKWFVPEDGLNVQMAGYDYCLRNFGYRTTWMAFIDVDEFITLNGSYTEIKSLLKNYRENVALTMNWMMFDSNDHEHRPVGGVLKNYHRCEARTLVKSIVKPKYVTGIYNAHRFIYRYGYHPVDVILNQVDGHHNPDPKVLHGNYTTLFEDYRYLFRDLFIRHYNIKSLEDYRRKKYRGDIFFKGSSKYDSMSYARGKYKMVC